MRPDNVWIGTIVTVYFLAITMGSFRLIYRYRTKQYYWDDMGAAGCVICNVITFAVMCAQGASAIEDVQQTRKVPFWLLWFFLPSALWTSRLSIAFSVLRLIKFGIWRRRLTIAVIIAFTLAWILTVVNYLIGCNIKVPRQPDCSTNVADIIFFVVYIIGDACLIYIPFHLLRNLRQPKSVRLMVLVTFSVSGILTFGAIVNTMAKHYTGPETRVLAEFIIILKAPIALIACSLIVVIPYIYRILKKEEEDWMVSMINIDIPDAPPTPSVVGLPERAVARNPSTQPFTEHVSDFRVDTLPNEGSCIHNRAASV